MGSRESVHGERESTPSAPAVKLIVHTSDKSERGNPASAQPMPGLSKRAQALLTRPNSSKIAVALEPAGSALVRLAKTRRSI